jgi:ubiquinone/menaquinone biosynthesis C-methylase UbiE
MNPRPNQRVLEIGFGTGQTLVEMACRFGQAEIFGLEKSPAMLDTARRRFRFAGLDDSNFQPMPPDLRCPFPDRFFDIVYCESVLAILPDEDLEKMWAEIFRLLRPGGSLFFNESLWRPGVTAEKIEKINTQCLAWFGIPQASATYPYPSNWQKLAESHGFRLLESVSLEAARDRSNRGFDFRLIKSSVFSFMGKLKTWHSATLRGIQKRIGQQSKLLAEGPPYLEGVFFHCEKSV